MAYYANNISIKERDSTKDVSTRDRGGGGGGGLPQPVVLPQIGRCSHFYLAWVRPWPFVPCLNPLTILTSIRI